MKKEGDDTADSESDLWHHVAKSVKPLNNKNIFYVPSDKSVPRVKKTEKSDTPALPTTVTQKSSSVDIRTEERLRRGQMRIDATLDLHGLSAERAWISLNRFLTSGYENGFRCVLVITGKGRAGAPGILKKSLPSWLSEPMMSKIVLRFFPAKPRHGGGGAFYILLRRKR